MRPANNKKKEIMSLKNEKNYAVPNTNCIGMTYSIQRSHDSVTTLFIIHQNNLVPHLIEGCFFSGKGGFVVLYLAE